MSYSCTCRARNSVAKVRRRSCQITPPYIVRTKGIPARSHAFSKPSRSVLALTPVPDGTSTNFRFDENWKRSVCRWSATLPIFVLESVCGSRLAAVWGGLRGRPRLNLAHPQLNYPMSAKILARTIRQFVRRCHSLTRSLPNTPIETLDLIGENDT